MVTPCRLGPLQGAGQGPRRLVTGRGVGDDLGQHGVVVDRDLGPVLHAAVDAHPGRGGDAEAVQAPGRGLEPPGGVLGVETHLDGVSRDRGAEHLGGKSHALGHQELEARRGRAR